MIIIIIIFFLLRAILLLSSSALLLLLLLLLSSLNISSIGWFVEDVKKTFGTFQFSERVSPNLYYIITHYFSDVSSLATMTS